MNPGEQLDLLMRYEQGDIDEEEYLQLFSNLISSGLAWGLQGHYGRTAKQFIETGIISPEGKILKTLWPEE